MRPASSLRRSPRPGHPQRLTAGTTSQVVTPRAGRVAYAILDVVTRKWLATHLTAEETATQVEVVFTQALDTEGLWPVVEARQADRARRGDDSDEEPILLAMSDNGPQMRAGTTREFLAPLLHRGPLRPARHPDGPSMDRDPVRPHQNRMAPPREDHRPQHAASRARHRPTRLQHPQSQNPDRDDPADGGWADYDDEGKRVLPVLRVSTSLDALLEGLHRAGITDSGESLSAATLRRMACDAEIIPTVLNSEGRVIDVGRRTRRVSEALRCVLIARDGGCVWPGCDAPPSRCDAHHIKHWANGGPTNADNLALLCHRHHILLHEGRHRLKRVDDAWVVLKPDGKPLHTPLAAPGGNNGSGRLRADDPITSCWPHSGGFPNLETAATTTTATVTKTTAAATPRPSRTPSAGLETAAYTARSAAILDVDPTKRSTNGAAQTPPRQLTLACGGRNELTMRLTAAELRDDKVQAGPTVGCGDSHARTALPVPVANRRPNPRSLTSPSAQNPSPILVTPRYHRFGWPGGAL